MTKPEHGTTANDRLCKGRLLQTTAVNTACEPGESIKYQEAFRERFRTLINGRRTRCDAWCCELAEGEIIKSFCPYKSQNDDDISPTHNTVSFLVTNATRQAGKTCLA